MSTLAIGATRKGDVLAKTTSKARRLFRRLKLDRVRYSGKATAATWNYYHVY